MLLIRTPDGSWMCDYMGGQMGPFDSARPKLTLTNAQGGEYNIWVGKKDGPGVVDSVQLNVSHGRN